MIVLWAISRGGGQNTVSRFNEISRASVLCQLIHRVHINTNQYRLVNDWAVVRRGRDVQIFVVGQSSRLLHVGAIDYGAFRE